MPAGFTCMTHVILKKSYKIDTITRMNVKTEVHWPCFQIMPLITTDTVLLQKSSLRQIHLSATLPEIFLLATYECMYRCMYVRCILSLQLNCELYKGRKCSECLLCFNYSASNHFLLIEIPEISFKESFYPIFSHILTAALDGQACISQHTTYKHFVSIDLLRNRHQSPIE